MQFAHRLRDGRQVTIIAAFEPPEIAPRDCWGQPLEPDEPGYFEIEGFECDAGLFRGAGQLSDEELNEIERAGLALVRARSDHWMEAA